MRSPRVEPPHTIEALESRLHLSGTHFVHKTASLSQARFFPAATTVGSQAMIAGGRLDNAGESDAVDIYDATTGRWSAAKLPESRHQIGATSVGKKAIFAGGGIGVLGSDTVDLYDSASGRWSTAKLSQTNTPSASVTVRNTALFVGGQPLNTSRVEIYNAAKDRWSTAQLSEARFYPVGTAVGSKAIFAGGGFAGGGFSDAVDIYDAASYHDRNGIDLSTPDDNDIFVTGPNGFNHTAQFVSKSRGKHASTQVVTYAVRGRGLHWDSTENGTYTIRLHSGQVSDVAGNAAPGDDLGTFEVGISPANVRDRRQ